MSLTREQWADLCQRVYERDLRTGYDTAYLNCWTDLSFAAWRADPRWAYGACVAWQFDDRLFGTCRGEIEFDHVHEEGDNAMGMKADDDERHLQSVCSWHHGTGRTGGAWVTSDVARAFARER